MSLLGWLRKLRFALMPSRDDRRHGRGGIQRATPQRPRLDILEDRLTPNFGYAGQYSQAQFHQMTGPDARWSGPEMILQTADFNADGVNDLLTVTFDEMTSPQEYFAHVDLSGPFGGRQTYHVGTGPFQIATGDFAIFGTPADGRPDFAIYKAYYENEFSYSFPVEVYRNLGPGISVTEYSEVTEGNAGTGAATFGVSLAYPITTDVTFDYSTADDHPDATATAGSDYIPTSGTVTIPAGQTGATFTVPVVGDRLPEPNETFIVRVSGVGSTFFAYGGILDDDDAPRISVGDAAVTEGNTGAVSATLAVTLSRAGSEAIVVDYGTADGTATGSDYQAASGTLTFAPGETQKTITVLVNGDRWAEPSETFVVNLSNPTGATIDDGRATGTIVDDEPRVRISDVSRAEGRRGRTTLFTFTVTLSAAYDRPVTMSFRTVNGTATTSDNDYVAKTGTLTFAAGQTTKTITIEVKGDNKREADELFYLDLSGLSDNALFTKSRGVGTIWNDD